MKMDISTAIGAFVAMVLLAVFLSFLLSWPVMWLWNNALVGAVNGVNSIEWVQAWGISMLCGILFKGQITKTKE